MSDTVTDTPTGPLDQTDVAVEVSTAAAAAVALSVGSEPRRSGFPVRMRVVRAVRAAGQVGGTLPTRLGC